MTSLTRLTFSARAVNYDFLQSIDNLPLDCVDVLDSADESLLGISTAFILKAVEQRAFPKGIVVHLK